MPVSIRHISPLRTVVVKHIERTSALSKRRLGVLIVDPWLFWSSTTDIETFVRHHDLVNVLHNRGAIFAPCFDELFKGRAIIYVQDLCWCAGASRCRFRRCTAASLHLEISGQARLGLPCLFLRGECDSRGDISLRSIIHCFEAAWPGR